MSFVNFLLYGPSHPSFNHFHADTSLQRLSIKPQPDDHRADQTVAKDLSNYCVTVETQFMVINGNKDPLLDVDCASMEAALQTWVKFNVRTSWIQAVSGFLFLAPLGALCWKPLPGNYGRLITAVAGAALAGVAFFAHYRKSETHSVLAHFPSKHTIAQQICNFRNYLLRAESNLEKNPLQMLDVNLRDQVEDFFTLNELSYLFTDVLFAKKRKLSPAELYEGFPCLKAIDQDDWKGSLIDCYGAFRRKVDFSEMQENVKACYHAWVAANVQGQIGHIQNPDNFSDTGDKKMAELFNKCFLDEMKDYLVPEEKEYFAAFEVVCVKIASLLEGDSPDATEYLKTQALTDFKNALYGPNFALQLADVVEAMNESLDEKNAAVWLQTQFTQLHDGPIKHFLLESLKTPLDND